MLIGLWRAAFGQRLTGGLRRAFLGPAIAFLVTLQLVNPLAADPSNDDTSQYSLAPGDRITVTVFGQPELSGDFLIDGSGAVLLPFVGPVTVKDLTVLECQKAIFDRLADGVLVHPSVSVRLSELRPIYVLGDVRTPGSYPFRYGNTVKGAVALAGGFGASETMQTAAASEFLLADERVRTLVLQKLVLLVRTARLEAQRDGAATFAPPPTLSALASQDDADINLADIVAVEQQNFESQAKILREQRLLLNSQKPRIENEIAAINSQISADKRQVELVTQEAEQYSHLVKQGLGVTNLETQLKVLQASHEGDVWGLTAQISRLELESVELDLKLQELDSAFQKQVVTDLQEAHYRLKEIELALASAKELRELRLRQISGLTDADDARSITVTRNRDGHTSILPAAETMALEPGDVVEVKRPPLPFLSHNASSARYGADLAPRKGLPSYEPGTIDDQRREALEASIRSEHQPSRHPESARLDQP